MQHSCLRVHLSSERIPRSAEFHFKAREKERQREISCIHTPHIGNWNYLYQGKSVHFFPFSTRKMHRTKSLKKELYRKSKQFSSLPRIPLVAQTHPKFFRGESEICLKSFSPQRGYSRFSSQPNRKHLCVSIFLSSFKKERKKLFFSLYSSPVIPNRSKVKGGDSAKMKKKKKVKGSDSSLGHSATPVFLTSRHGECEEHFVRIILKRSQFHVIIKTIVPSLNPLDLFAIF